jgi:hypothetical protein
MDRFREFVFKSLWTTGATVWWSILNLTPAYSKEPFFFAGLGAFGRQLGSLSTQSTQEQSFLSSIAPILALHTQFSLGSNLSHYFISPSLAFTPLASKSSDGSYSISYFPISVRMLREFQSAEISAGVGYLISRISGAGGSSVQNNGTSTSTFIYPDQSTTTGLATLNLGGSFRFLNAKVGGEAWISGVLSQRRAVNLLVSVQYGFF